MRPRSLIDAALADQEQRVLRAAPRELRGAGRGRPSKKLEAKSTAPTAFAAGESNRKES